MIIVLYDGWPLRYDPNGPAALTLLALLAHSPAEVQAHVALPGAPFTGDLTPNAIPNIFPTSNTSVGLLFWEHRLLPTLARRLKANLLHLTSPGAALLSRTSTILSPTGLWEEPDGSEQKGASLMSREFSEPSKARSFIGRLLRSLDEGGLVRLGGLLWPANFPLPAGRLASIPLYWMPVAVHPSFSSASLYASQAERALNLPEAFVLYHGPRNLKALFRLLDAWSWAANSIGAQYPLVLPGMTASDHVLLNKLIRDDALRETVQPLPPVPLSTLAQIYRSCAALFHPAPISPWGSPVSHALACGRPVVAAESRLSDALVGAAAYLAPPTDLRALGAAIITVAIEEEVSGRLIRAARQRAASWKAQDFSAALLEAYRAVIYSS